MELQNHNENLIIKIDQSELDLNKTFNCGQAFRWNKLSNGAWCGVVNNKIFMMKQIENTIYTNIPYIDKDFIVNYLNLDMAYSDKIKHIDLEHDEYLTKAYEASKGIHILRQDLFEMIITFIISQMNSMNNIRNCVENLSKTFGDKISTVIYADDNTQVNITNWSFPTPEVLSQASLSDIRSCKVGFRDEYIKDISEFISNVPIFIDELNKAEYKTAIKMLKNFRGIGDKVANCICLFGLHHIQAFPVDTHIQQIADKYYNGHIDISKYGDIAGIVQQYMFYYKALCKGE